ncbi:MAG: PQQ-like beta-propeller repeat protein [Bacteroidales bacterium]|nr:PQQ-like beta-propeller repeat protein [Bacteroidales bacterium]
MRNRKWITVFLAGVLVLSSINSISAQDWTQWRGANRDGKVNSFTAPESWPPELTMQWRESVGTGDATPVLVGNRLYLFTRQDDKEVILCLDAESGAEQWRNEYLAPAVTGAAARHPGPRSTPAVSDGRMVTLGASGILSCLDTPSGKLLWRKDPFPGVVPRFFTSMSPMIVDDLCIAHLGGAGNGAIIAYEMNSGNELWRWAEEGPDYGSPVLLTIDSKKMIVSPTEKSIIGVGLSDGKLLWKLPFVPQSRAYNAATPIVHGNTVIYTGAGRGTHAVQIEKQGEDFVVSELWSNADLAVQFNTPVLKQNLLYGYSNTGILFCLDAVTGQTAWTDTIKHDRSGFAAILDVGPVIMALPSSSELIVFKPLKEEYSELANIKIADLPTYATPVVAGNRIYIKDEQSITLWKIK